MQIEPESLPTDLADAHAMIRAEREARLAAEMAGAATRLALDIEIERLKLEIARLRRDRFGASSERSARIEQLELKLEDLEEAAAEIAAADPVTVMAGAMVILCRALSSIEARLDRLEKTGLRPANAAQSAASQAAINRTR